MIQQQPFSRVEDHLLLWTTQQQAEQGIQNKWTTIGEHSFQNARSSAQIRKSWYSASFKNFVKNEFGPNMSEDLAKQL